MLIMNILSRTQKQLLPHISRIFSASPDLSQFRLVYLASFLAIVLLNIWMAYVTPRELTSERMNVLSYPFSSNNYIVFGKQLYATGDINGATQELRLAEQVSTVRFPFSFFVPYVLGAQSEPNDIIRDWEQDQMYVHRAYSFWKTIVLGNPDYRDAYVTLAVICARIDKTDEAIMYIKTAYRLDPNNETVKVLAGQLGVLL